MTRFRILFPILAVLTLSGNALGVPRVFNDAREGIEFARKNDRLILFMLLNDFDDESDDLEKTIHAKMSRRDSEYVVVRCRVVKIADRKLFTEKFRQNVKKAPMAVVTDTHGKPVAVASGDDPNEYRRMFEASRIKAGVEKDPEKIMAIIEELGPEGEEYLFDGTFGIKKKDVAAKRLPLTDHRVWIFKNGATLRGALLEAKGETGVFIRQDNQKQVEVKFSDLSDPDTAFLGTILKSKPAGE